MTPIKYLLIDGNLIKKIITNKKNVHFELIKKYENNYYK